MTELICRTKLDLIQPLLVLTRFVGVSTDPCVSHQDFYATSDGHVLLPEDGLQDGAVYRLEPRLRGGKGGQWREQSAPCRLLGGG